MTKDELRSVFDRQAPSYNTQWGKMAPIYQAMYFLVESVFFELPVDARILCVGVGTGKELIHLAQRFPSWRFTAVEPATAMLDECRREVSKLGFDERCDFHEGYLDSLPSDTLYDGATCFLVSQFILENDARSTFFKGIASRLKPGGILANTDLSADINSARFDTQLRWWRNIMSPFDTSSEGLERMHAAYANNVSVLPPEKVAAIIAEGGFERPELFFQACLIHSWAAKTPVKKDG